jgi:hypothetical protein
MSESNPVHERQRNLKNNQGAKMDYQQRNMSKIYC